MKVLKTIQDLKNPVTAIAQIINEPETLKHEIQTVKSSINIELEDLDDLLDNLKLEFKSKHGLEINEVPRECKTTELLKSLRRTQNRLAKNGRNKLIFESENNFPEILLIH